MTIHYILNCVYYFQYFVLLLCHLWPYYAGSSHTLVHATGRWCGRDFFCFCACSAQSAWAVWRSLIETVLLLKWLVSEHEVKLVPLRHTRTKLYPGCTPVLLCG